jgi:hypothetical protein
VHRQAILEAADKTSARSKKDAKELSLDLRVWQRCARAHQAELCKLGFVDFAEAEEKLNEETVGADATGDDFLTCKIYILEKRKRLSGSADKDHDVSEWDARLWSQCATKAGKMDKSENGGRGGGSSGKRSRGGPQEDAGAGGFCESHCVH